MVHTLVHDAVPCEHMAAVVVSSRIPQLTRANIMPYWWRTDHLRLQFPNDVLAACNLSIEMIREEGIANSNVMLISQGDQRKMRDKSQYLRTLA